MFKIWRVFNLFFHRYLQDADNTLLPPVTPWRWILRIFVLLFQVSYHHYTILIIIYFFKNPTNFLQNILQIAPILRYLDSIRYGLLSRKFGQIEKSPNLGSEKKKEAREQRIKYYTLMVYEDADATLLRLFECFMESAPQLILQVSNTCSLLDNAPNYLLGCVIQKRLGPNST